MSERQVEIPALLEFISTNKPTILLDVGCADTEYSGLIEPYIWRYNGIDIRFCQDPHLDDIVQDDFLNPSYIPDTDTIISISTIEHDLDPTRFMRKIVKYSKKNFFVTFPVGDMFVREDNFRAISEDTLKSWDEFLPPMTKIDFFFSYHPNDTSKSRWFKVPRSYATKTKYDRTVGVQSVCIMRGHK